MSWDVFKDLHEHVDHHIIRARVVTGYTEDLTVGVAVGRFIISILS